MHTSFIITGIVLGALLGFKTGFGGWGVAGFAGILIESILGINLINIADPWAAGIGGLVLGNAVGALAKFIAKS